MRALLLTLLAAASLVSPPATRAAAHDPLPLDRLMAPPDVEAVSLSPDGAWLAWVAPWQGAANLWVAPTDRPAQRRPLTRLGGRGLTPYDVSGDPMVRWTADSKRLLFARDRDGDECFNWWSVEVTSGDTVALTPRPGAHVKLLGVDATDGRRALFGIDDRDPRLHDLWRSDVATGELTLVKRNEGLAAWIVDGALTPRLGAAIGEGGAVWVLAADDTGGWNPLWSIPPSEPTGKVLGFAPGGRTMWVLGARDRDRAALLEVSLPDGASRVLAEDARADLGGALRDPASGRPQACWADWTRRGWTVLDSSVAGDLARLRAHLDGDLDVLSRTRDDRRWLVRWTLSDRPVTYGLYERPSGRVTRLFSSHAALEGRPFPPLHAAVIPARDSLPLVSYWCVPLASDPDGDGRPSRPLPTVMIVHGGPSDERATYGFHPFVQWLADRGYAVMVVNFRGSPGFGRAFQAAERLEWGGRMNLDLVDQARWAIERGIADSTRIGILGGSYGGYAVLAALTLTPGVFACGIDVVGPSDLETFLSTIPAGWSLDHLAARVGDPRTEAGRAHLRARSPIHFTDHVKVPVLIGQGAHDSRVPQAESDRMVAALDRAGSRVTYLLFPDEGHGFQRPANERAFWAVAEAFLSRALGGRAGPLGDGLDGSSVQVPVGADRIPGLAEALARGAGH
jgi:dipeptidyl aminopeptidase/acylaminoacyl peptidase